MARFGKTFWHVLANVITTAVSLIVVIPVVVLLLNSFKTQGESNSMSLSLPKKWVTENYATVIEQGKLISSFFNGLLYAMCSVMIIVVFVSAAAYVI